MTKKITRKVRKASFRAWARYMGVTLAQAKMIQRRQQQGMAALMTACLKALGG